MKYLSTLAILTISISPLKAQNKMNQNPESTSKKFTLEEMLAAHAKTKTGADFPKYIQEIKAMGLVTYDFFVKDGVIIYHGENGYEVKGYPKYEPLTINKTANAEALKHTITIHQQGQTDFITFCNQAADAGVEKWTIDTHHMVCNYAGQNGNIMVSEPIPTGEYK
jgi:uncharacterized protein YbcV (DUF1398 family)